MFQPTFNSYVVGFILDNRVDFPGLSEELVLIC